MTEARKRERENDLMILDDEEDDIIQISTSRQPTLPDLAKFMKSNQSKKPRVDESSEIYNDQLSLSATFGSITPGDEFFSIQENLQYPDSPKAATATDSATKNSTMSNSSEDIVKDLGFMNGKEDDIPSLFAYYEDQMKDRMQSSFAASLEIEPLDLTSELGFTLASSSSTRQTLPLTQNKNTYKYSRPPTTGSYITANCPLTGKTLYLPRMQRSKEKFDVVNKIKKASLLSKPVTLMTKEIEAAERERKMREENERRTLQRRRKKKRDKAKTEQLWVEKYKPKAFIDLLGDQRVNRDVLRWIKEWDYCVFGKKPTAESERERAMRQYKNVFGNSAASRKMDITDKPKDKLLRPDKKILLLSGPPGFGKTTLAHVAAVHAGYNIIEINASDDRTGDAIKSKVKAALEMQAIIKQTDTSKDGKEKVKMEQKPNLLIIDEIDGASSSGGSDSFIKQLVQLATADVSKDDEDESVKRKGKGERPTPLLRPIICICNDAYAPVLRPLRAIAQHIQFRKIPMLTIGKRLQEICDEEDLETDLRTLCLLAESTDGDIRSCLHTLQFIRGKSDTFSREMLKEAGLGQKDMAKSLFAIWDELFCAIDARNHSSMQITDSKQRYLNRLLQTVSSNGEYERIMQGCFEAYPKMRFNDVAGKKVVMMSDWLDFYDHLNHRVNDLHEYSVHGYLPFPIINFHRYFAGSVIQDHKVEYPRVDYEKFISKKSHENLINVFLEGINPAQRRALHKKIIVTELIPRLLRIISPDLRPVNKQLIKPAEVAVLSKLVRTMIDFGLTFIQDKNEDGQFVYKLEPPIEQIMNFERFGIKGVLNNKYAVRQLVAQEIEAELLRRREAAMEQRGTKLSLKTKNASTIQETIKRASKETIKPQVAKDFFGRPIQPDTTPRRNKQVEVSKAPVAYRYHEGFSNAVRKPMTVSMFL